MPNLSIFSSEPLAGLVRSTSAERLREDLRRVVVFVLALPLVTLPALLTPLELLPRNFLRTNPVQVVHHPAAPPLPGVCETTSDGFLHFPAPMSPDAAVLVVGNSHSDWFRYPRYLDQQGRRDGPYLKVYSAARPACSVLEMLDTLVYLTRRIPRQFDAVVVKPGVPMFDQIAHPADQADSDPPVGSGFSVIQLGLPLDGQAFSLGRHLQTFRERRRTDRYLVERTRRMKAMHDQTKPDKKVELPTDIPPAVQAELDAMLARFETQLTAIAEICQASAIPLVLMTTPGRRFDLSKEEVKAMVMTTPAYFNRYSILGINHLIAEAFNDRLRQVAAKTGAVVVDSVEFAEELRKTLPEEEIYEDFVHFGYRVWPLHGEYLYHQIQSVLGPAGIPLPRTATN